MNIYFLRIIIAVFFLLTVPFVSFSQNKKNIYKKGWIDFNKNGLKDVYEDPQAPIDKRIADLISQMTIEEKHANWLPYMDRGVY